ncbi:CPBP family intramembrane metalloprotease [Erysipelothrix sp. HDW6B]|uniref:CPBP family intramembrane glutamic endopeptidase n=1 Tax=Erysipelothrix sp. HDW6B TaxID=2714929 RepID=UPI00140D4A60|nr:CPBP family intramembrane glutamic endopeptidase [Erysipelothrix sp. HDW6B]QIK86392.1 CPBP family intramembrane metalloprotease [Erysipelothrix sp. HDW6B]
MIHVSLNQSNKNAIFTLKETLGVLAHYFVGMQFAYPLLGMWVSLDILKIKASYSGIMVVSLGVGFFGMLYIVRKTLRLLIRDFKKRWRYLCKQMAIGAVILGIVNLFMNWIILLIWGNGAIAANQELVYMKILNSPISAFFSIVCVTPFVEEIVFRGVLYQKFGFESSQRIGVIISSLLFGMFHAWPGDSMGISLLLPIYLFQYTVMGFLLAKYVAKTETIFTSIGIHFLNNLIGYIGIILMIG